VPVDFGIDRIATARLVGRRPVEGDRAELVRIFTDPRTPEEAWPEHLRTADRVEGMLEESIRHWERWGFGVWTVLADGKVVGRAGLAHTRDTGRPEVEVAWFVDPEAWNRGYATEIAREAIRVAREVLELDTVVAFTLVTNTASQRVMAKLGMGYERDIVHAGLPHVLYRLSPGS
jgi:[ribosomal protein S5]-alanine N-acetyltransferase